MYVCPMCERCSQQCLACDSQLLPFPHPVLTSYPTLPWYCITATVLYCDLYCRATLVSSLVRYWKVRVLYGTFEPDFPQLFLYVHKLADSPTRVIHSFSMALRDINAWVQQVGQNVVRCHFWLTRCTVALQDVVKLTACPWNF